MMFFKKKKVTAPDLITVKEILVVRSKGYNVVWKNNRLYCGLKER